MLDLHLRTLENGGACSALQIHYGGGKVAVDSQGCEQVFVGSTMSSTMVEAVFLD